MAYRAEIEIGVKGAKQLEEAFEQIKKLSRQIDNTNKREIFGTKQVASVNQYSKALQKASNNLNKARIQLDDAGNATKTYEKAINQYVDALGKANQAQKITSDLVQREIDARTQATAALKAYNAEAASARQVGSMAGAYLRPAEASLKGQTSDVSAALAAAKHRLSVERGIGEVQESLARLDNQSIKAHNDRLNLQTEYLAVLERTADAANFRAQQSQQPLALPSSEMLAARDSSIQRIKTGEDLINESIQRGNLLRDRAVTADARRAEKIREQTEALTGVKNSLPGFESLVGQSSPISPVRTAEGARAATGFPIALPEISLDKEIEQRNKINSIIDDQITFNDKISNGLKKQRAVGLDINNLEKTDVKLIQQQGLLKQRELRTEEKIQAAIKKNTKTRRAQENALIGGAFPLLFGQGLGASAGGALGGFVGGKAGGQFGFGLSLVGTAVGQAFDDATKRVTEMGNALRTLDLSALEGSSIRVSEELKFQVEKLKESGKFAEARALVEQAVAKQTGSTATVIKDIANSGNLLKAAFDEVLASGSVLLGAVAAPFAALLAGILKILAEIFKSVNRIIAFVGGLLRQVEQIVDPGRNIQRAIERIAPAAAEATVEMKKLADELARSVDLAQQAANFDLKQAKFSLVDSTENKIEKRRNELARELNDIQLDINDRLAEAAKLNAKERAERVGAIKVLQATLNRTAELNALHDIANIKIAEQLRLNKENLRIEERRSQEVKERMAQADKELLAVIEANQAEARVGNFVLPIATPFQGFTDEEIRKQEELKINQEKRNKLQLLERQNISDLLKFDKRRQIIAETNLAILQLSTNFINKRRQEDETRIRSIAKANANLDDQIDLIKARLAGTQDEVRLNQELNSIVESIKGISGDEIEILREKLILLGQIKEAEEKFNIQQKTKFAGAGLQAGFIGEAGQAFENSLIDGKSRGEAREIAQLTEQMAIAQTQAQALESAVLGIGNAFATAMTTGVSELIAGTKSAEEVFANFLKSIGDALISAAQQMIAQYIAIGIARMFAGMPGSDSKAINPDSLMQIQDYSGIGANTDVSGLIPRANGGPVRAGQSYLVGERGPELFVPRAQGNIVPNHAMGSSTNVVVNVDAKGTAAQGDEAQAGQLGKLIGAAVQAELIKQQRPGGLLTR